MTDNVLSTALFTLIVAGVLVMVSHNIDTRAIRASHAAAKTEVATEIVRLPMVTVTGHRDAGDANPATVAAAPSVATTPANPS